MPKVTGGITFMQRVHTMGQHHTAQRWATRLDKPHFQELGKSDIYQDPLASSKIFNQANPQFKPVKFIEFARQKFSINSLTAAYLNISNEFVLAPGASWGDIRHFWVRHGQIDAVKNDCTLLKDEMEVCFNNTQEGYYIKESKAISNPTDCQTASCIFFADSKITSRWTRLKLGEFPNFDWVSLVHPGVRNYLPADEHISSDRLIRQSHTGPINMHLEFKEIVWRIEGSFTLIVPPNDLGNINNTFNAIIDIPLANQKGYLEGLVVLVNDTNSENQL